MSRRGGEGAIARLAVRLPGGGSYPVVVGPGASREAPDHVAPLGVSRCAVVTDSNLESTHAARAAGSLRSAGLASDVIAFPAGEGHKTRATKESIEDRMIGLGMGRDTVLVAVGGGVTGDLGGFVAATYMRGIPFIQIPTSLLAMADASIGGKTGVDHPLGKNLIGAFHPPSAVLSDPDFLSTLPLSEFRAGLAEMVKAGVVADAELFAELEARAPAAARGDPGSVAAPLQRAVAAKVAVVSADERESALRKILNFGHTVGHALEVLSGFSLPHGEAISIGMVAESAMAVRLGLLDRPSARRIADLLDALGLPTALPRGTDPKAVMAAAGSDKKARSRRLEFALPEAVGKAYRAGGGYTTPVPEDVALAALEETRAGG